MNIFRFTIPLKDKKNKSQKALFSNEHAYHSMTSWQDKHVWFRGVLKRPLHMCETNTCAARVCKSSAPSKCRPWCNVLIQEWKRCLKWRYKDMAVNIQQVGKKLGCYSIILTALEPRVMLWLLKPGANCICSGMLNRVYGVMADGNCFAVTVTVSPCRTRFLGENG